MNRKIEIVRSPHMGYCFGVKRAMSLIDEGMSPGSEKMFTIGDVIHNRQAVEKLRARGLEPVRSLDEIPDGGTLVVRAHGVDPEILENAAARNIKIIDTTCPFVSRIHNHVKNLSEESCRVIVIGDADHPEVRGIAGRARGGALILDSTDQARDVAEMDEAGVVIQTTYSRDRALAIIDILRKRVRNLRVFYTICRATTLRREATLELAAETDLILIIGGRKSSNTIRLYQMCVDSGINARFIETADDIDPAWFGQCRRIGLATGTSTPGWIIDDVIERLSSI